MNIRDVIAIINQMQADGVIADYAIGGAIGAIFYLEPFGTLDVDVFVALDAAPGSLIVTLQPIYDYLTARGCVLEREYIVVSGTPVQFLPPGSPLVEEALREAVEKERGRSAGTGFHGRAFGRYRPATESWQGQSPSSPIRRGGCPGPAPIP